MDSSRCVVVEFTLDCMQDVLLKYLRKHLDEYNWILKGTDMTRIFIWWKKKAEFSSTPLRSVLKRLKSKMVAEKLGYLTISRKMSSKEGVQRVFNGKNILTAEDLQQSIHHLESSMHTVIFGIKESVKEEEIRTIDPSTMNAKLDLLLKFTSYIAKKVSQRGVMETPLLPVDDSIINTPS